VIALCVFAFVGLAVAYLLFAPPVYEAVATLEARPMSLQTGGEETFGKVLADGSISVVTPEDIATTAVKLARREFLLKVASSDALKGLQGMDTDELVAFVGYGLVIAPIKDTRLIDVKFRDTDPATAALVANTFCNVVLKDGLATRAGNAGQQIQDLEADYATVDARMDEEQRRLALYQRAKELREALILSRNEVKLLGARYKEKHPKMIEALGVVASQERALAEEFAAIRAHEVEKAYWDKALAAFAESGPDHATLENLVLGRHAFLNAELLGLQDLHSSLQVRLNEIRIANNSTDLDLKVFQTATPPAPDKEVAPKKPLVLGGGIFLGSGFGTALALFLGIARPRISNANDWKRVMGIPLLGGLNEFPSAETTPFEIVDASKGYNPLMEQVRNLRNRLVSPPPAGARAILVTSPLPEEGKTTVTSALALSLARLQESGTVVVDLDLQRPSLHKDLRLPNDLGISDVLLGKCSLEDALIEAGGLHVLTAGSRPFEALDSLGSDALPRLLQSLKERFRFVVIDAPPALPTADARLIAPLADDVILLANARHTPVAALLQAEEELAGAGVTLRGGILNQLPARRHRSTPQYKYLVKAYEQVSRRLVPHGLR
jgi:capsular exopolysaccharide synthesis family protein